MPCYGIFFQALIVVVARFAYKQKQAHVVSMLHVLVRIPHTLERTNSFVQEATKFINRGGYQQELADSDALPYRLLVLH